MQIELFTPAKRVQTGICFDTTQALKARILTKSGVSLRARTFLVGRCPYGYVNIKTVGCCYWYPSGPYMFPSRVAYSGVYFEVCLYWEDSQDFPVRTRRNAYYFGRKYKEILVIVLLFQRSSNFRPVWYPLFVVLSPT